MTSLAQHLVYKYLQEHSQVNRLYEVMRIVSPDLLGRSALFEVAQSRLDGTESCPLVCNGCSFRLALDAPDMAEHLRTHQLPERVKLYDTVKKRLPVLSLNTAASLVQSASGAL